MFKSNHITTLTLPQLEKQYSIESKLLEAKLKRLERFILSFSTDYEGIKKELNKDRAKQALIFEKMRTIKKLNMLDLNLCTDRTKLVTKLLKEAFNTFQ